MTLDYMQDCLDLFNPESIWWHADKLSQMNCSYDVP